MPRTTTNTKSVVFDTDRIFGCGDEVRCYRLTPRMIQLLLTPLAVALWQTRWTDASNFGAILDLVAHTQMALLSPVDCGATDGESDGGRGVSSSANLDDFIFLMRELNVKYRINGELYEAVIDLVPCDCGSGSALDEDNIGAIGVGGSTGGSYGEETTLCAFITAATQGIIDNVDNFIGRLQSGSYVAGAFAGITPEFVQDLIDSVDDSLDAVEGELNDPNFRIILEDAIARALPDPLPERLRRQDVFKLANRIPVVFEGAPMWSVFQLWAAQVNLNEIAALIRQARGQCGIAGQNALNRVGRESYEDSISDDVTIIAGGYELRRVATAVNIVANAGTTVIQLGEITAPLRGVLWRYRGITGQNPTSSSWSYAVENVVDSFSYSVSSASARQVEAFTNGEIFSDMHGISPTALRSAILMDAAAPAAFQIPGGKSVDRVFQDINTDPLVDPIPAGTNINLFAFSNRNMIIDEIWTVYDL